MRDPGEILLVYRALLDAVRVTNALLCSVVVLLVFVVVAVLVRARR